MDGKPKDFEKMVARYLGAEKEKRAEYDERLSATQDPEKPKKEDIDTEANSYGYLNAVRDKAVWAWKNSEEWVKMYFGMILSWRLIKAVFL